LLHGRGVAINPHLLSDSPTAAAAAARPMDTRPHVLVADGDAQSRRARELQLAAAGFRVSVARTGFEAIVKATCRVPDLILLDDSLADIDSTDTGRLLTTCPTTAHIPVVRLLPGRRVPRRAILRAHRAVV
jgi:CheY-like chemotaxis protein